jgi:hypothetical protein
MRAYIVRLKDGAELVGIFVSPSVDTLWRYVDECCDPYECEFLRLPPGGLYLGKPGAASIPTIIEDLEDNKLYPDWFAGAVVSELWLDIFYDDLKWEAITPSSD